VSRYQPSALAVQTGMLQLGFADPASVHIHITNMTYGVWQYSQFTSMMALGNNLDLADNTITVEVISSGM